MTGNPVAPVHPDDPVGPRLAALAADCGVSVDYVDSADRPTAVPAATVRAVLGLLGVDAPDETAAAARLAERTEAHWHRLLPPTVTARTGRSTVVDVHCPRGGVVTVTITTEDGEQLPQPGPGEVADRRGERDRRRLVVPPLPTGRHRLEVAAGDEQAAATLLVAPTMLPVPTGRRWGWAVQLYATASAQSWGLGDYADLADLTTASAQAGAGLVLVNPLHAITPAEPVQNSPYSPSSRRFRSMLYLRPEATPEYDLADDQVRATVDALNPGPPTDRIDRAVAFRARREALDLLFEVARADRGRTARLAEFRDTHGEGLVRHGVFCALAEAHGEDARAWPAALQSPTSDEVAAEAERLADRVDHHVWQQLLCDEQLETVARAAEAMPVGVVHDLAVGVSQGGSDAWALADVLATDARAGCPPDDFNQLGQDWSLPPWRPDRLAETGYEAFGDMIRTTLRHAGGLRVDHVLGLFRLWWIPPGATGAEGTYVAYDHEAMLTVLSLEVHRAGAVVVGEDLGTVQPWVREVLAERGLLGSSVLWFETEPWQEGQDPVWVDPEGWRRLAMTSVTTHDLPTAAGMIGDVHVAVRADLHLLAGPQAEEAARTAAERRGLVAMLARQGLLDPDLGVPADGSPITEPDQVTAVVRALHAALVASPALLVTALLPDAVGDLRQPNLPGTVDQYPNWRLPVAGPDGRTLLLDELLAHPGVTSLASLLTDGLRAQA